MSTSPKYSSVRLREEQERRLREERARQAELELKRRQEESERLRKQRVAEARGAAAERVQSLRDRLSQFEDREAAKFVDGQLSVLRSRVDQLEREIQRTDDDTLIREKSDQLAQARDELNRIMAQGEAEKRSAGLAKEAAALEILKHQVPTLDQHHSLKFDSQGWRDLKAILTEAEHALQKQALAQTERLVADASRKLERHRKTVESGYQQWAAERGRATAAMSRVAETLAGLQVDQVVMRWQAKQVEDLRNRSNLLQSLVEAEQFAILAGQAEALVLEAGLAISRAQELQLKEERRNYIVNGILTVMQQMGFVADPNPPQVEYSGYPESAVIIQAWRVGGSALKVSVPQEGELWYAVDGFPMRVEPDGAGGEAKSCDEAQAEIEKLHQSLESEFGIETGELWWKGKDPNRVHKRAERLPDQVANTSTANRTRQFGQ